MSKKLDPSVVIKISRMGKLYHNPTPEFIDKFGTELGAILGYVDELNEVDVTGVDPLSGYRTILISELREDVVEEDQDSYKKIRQNIIDNFPNKQGDLLVVSNIFNS
jgi:aspartyl-tRNA(Asn)/glutamyl-tRNA(Gln) amidotransferase subunit C